MEQPPENKRKWYRAAVLRYGAAVLVGVTTAIVCQKLGIPNTPQAPPVIVIVGDHQTPVTGVK